MLHHVAVPLLPSPGVGHLLEEGDLLDGVDGVEIMFDPDAMLSEVCSHALPPVDVIIARTGLSFLQHFSFRTHPTPLTLTCRTHFGPFLLPMKLVEL